MERQLPYTAAAASGELAVAGFFGCVGGFEYGGGRLCSGENGSRMSISVALLLCTEVVIVAEEDVGHFERFWLAPPKEVSIPALLKPAMVRYADDMILLDASLSSMCFRLLLFFTSEGNLISSGSGDEGVCLRLSPLWGHCLRVDFGDRRRRDCHRGCSPGALWEVWQ
jgi:hypothetical protein